MDGFGADVSIPSFLSSIFLVWLCGMVSCWWSRGREWGFSGRGFWLTGSRSTYYNYTGNATSIYNQFVAPLQEFTITPSSAFGVA